MSQQFLYGNPLKALNPPKEWKSNGIDSIVNDNVIEATPTTNLFTFTGAAASAILQWKQNNGVYNGMPFREVFFDGTITNTVFDGYLKLDELEYNSSQNPIILRCPIVKLDDPKTILDDITIMTQGVLRKQNYLVSSDYVDVPVRIRSRLSRKEKQLILLRYGGSIVTTASQVMSNLLSAMSDVAGVSIAIGFLELVIVMTNAFLALKNLIDEGIAIKTLLFPSEVYYKAASIKTIITKAVQSKGFTVDFGILDPLVSKTYLLSSQYENPGFPVKGLPGVGIMQRADFGYRISEILEGLDTMCNLRVAIIGNVLHIRPRVDPFWTQVPSYIPTNVLIRTVEQYANGVYRDDTQSIKASVVVNYQYDQTDQWTLTEKTGDSHEVRRKLISEIDPKKNTLRGIESLEIPWAMCVRDEGLDELGDLFNNTADTMNSFLSQVVNLINQFNAQITATGAPVTTSIEGILSLTGLDQIIPIAGALKISDDSFSIPKIVYLEDFNLDGNIEKRIPENFKDFVGAPALYNNWRLPESPADINEFKGQYRLVDSLTIRFSQKAWVQTTTNPFFILNSKNAYFTFTNWIEDKHKASAGIRIQDVFDTNITEEEI